jgi:hypothetical protein
MVRDLGYARRPSSMATLAGMGIGTTAVERVTGVLSAEVVCHVCPERSESQ